MFALLGIAAVTGLIIVAWRYGGGQSPTVLPTGPGLTTAQPPLGAGGPAPALLSIRGIHGSSLVQVRARSADGRPLYSGTIEPGAVQRFRNPKKLWVRIEIPQNVRVVVDGHTVLLSGKRRVTALVADKQLHVLGR
jgi:hypothetical protein